MTDFDETIQRALRSESDEVWRDVAEDGLLTQAVGVMRTHRTFVRLVVTVGMTVMTALMAASAIQFFRVDTTRGQIGWAAGFIVANLAIAMMKLWFWMQMDRNRVLREVKRLELQVATLAGIMKGQS